MLHFYEAQSPAASDKNVKAWRGRLSDIRRLFERGRLLGHTLQTESPSITLDKSGRGIEGTFRFLFPDLSRTDRSDSSTNEVISGKQKRFLLDFQNSLKRTRK